MGSKSPYGVSMVLETILLNLASHSDRVSALVRARLSFPRVCLVVGQPFQAVVLTGWKAGPWSFYICSLTIESFRASPDYIGGKGDFPKSSNVINHGAGMEASKHGATIGG
jgi:hypothetical protein